MQPLGLRQEGSHLGGRNVGALAHCLIIPLLASLEFLSV